MLYDKQRGGAFQRIIQPLNKRQKSECPHSRVMPATQKILGGRKSRKPRVIIVFHCADIRRIFFHWKAMLPPRKLESRR